MARAKLAKRGAPCSLVKCGWNTSVGRYGKVGYLTPIVRYHIKPAHPKRHAGGTDSTTLDGLSCSPPPVQQWGRVYYSGSSPLHFARYVMGTCILSIGLRLILAVCSSAL